MSKIVSFIRWFTEARLTRAVIIVYVVGTIGFLNGSTRPIFEVLIPVNLLFVAFALFITLRDLQPKHWVTFLLIALLGFGVEVVGVNTGWPFGDYIYGLVLGPKVWHTPLLIGINWLVLIIATQLMVRNRLPGHKLMIPFLGATWMLVFDVALEPFAINTGMWNWFGTSVPSTNYIAWWVIAFVLHWVVVFLPLRGSARVANVLFFSQIVFFVIVNAWNRL